MAHFGYTLLKWNKNPLISIETLNISKLRLQRYRFSNNPVPIKICAVYESKHSINARLLISTKINLKIIWHDENIRINFRSGTLVALRCQRSSADRADRFRRTHRSPQQEELEVQMMFVLLAITIVFTLCWTPLQVMKLSTHASITSILAINYFDLVSDIKKPILRAQNCIWPCWRLTSYPTSFH